LSQIFGMTIRFYQQLNSLLEQDGVVLATIVNVVGSAPRELGAKMAVSRDGTILGTIGGGAGEAKVIRQAQIVWETNEKQRVDIDLSGATHRESQGICGGIVQVWLERWAGEAAIALVAQILETLTAGNSVTLVTPMTADQYPYLEASHLNNSLPFTHSEMGFWEVLHPPPLLLIVGAGHVAVPLALMANQIEFQVVVQDDRTEFANPYRFPQATVLATSIEKALASLPSNPQLYIALVTRGYQYDLVAMQLLLQSSRPYEYLGLIGSKKRINKVQHALNLEAVSPEKLCRIYAPIGLDIGALTPEEIAISICAELIKVRRGGTGLSLSERLKQADTRSKAAESIHLGLK